MVFCKVFLRSQIPTPFWYLLGQKQQRLLEAKSTCSPIVRAILTSLNLTYTPVTGFTHHREYISQALMLRSLFSTWVSCARVRVVLRV